MYGNPQDYYIREFKGSIRIRILKKEYDRFRLKKEGKCMAETSGGIFEAKDKGFIRIRLLNKGHDRIR